MATPLIQNVTKSGIKLNYLEIEQLMYAELAGYQNRPVAHSRGFSPLACMYALVGSAGIGKTYFWKRFALKHKLPIRRIVFGEKELEDNLGIPSGKLGEDGHHIMLAPPGFPIEVPETETTTEFDLIPNRNLSGSAFPGKGLLLANEVLSGSVKQESQIRSMISDRIIGDLRIADGWIIVGDTNPLDQKYHTVQQMDESIQSRIIFLPVDCTYESSMQYWQDTHELPDILYGFLRTHKKLWESLDNRRWVQLGDKIMSCLNNGVSNSVLLKLVSCAGNDVIAQAFHKYRAHGDDPYYYPILATNYVSANKSEHASHMEIMERWKSDAEWHVLLNLSGLDLLDWLNSRARETMTHKEIEFVVPYLADMLTAVGTAQAVELLEATKGNLVKALWPLIKNTPLAEEISRLNKIELRAKAATTNP